MIQRYVIELRCDGRLSCGEIYEYESYEGQDDPARHARKAARRDGWDCEPGLREKDYTDLCPSCSERKPRPKT